MACGIFWFSLLPGEADHTHNVNNDDLLDICKFYTSKAKDKPISLKTYIDRMKAEQKDIYYITGTSIDNIDTSPQVEGFKSRDIEVLYLFFQAGKDLQLHKHFLLMKR